MTRSSSGQSAIARNGKLFLLGAALLTLATSPAFASSIDFSDVRGDGESQSAQLQVDGVSVTVTASSGASEHFERAGCSGRSRHCRGEQRNRPNGRQDVPIRIQLGDGPVQFDSADSSRVGRRDQASVSTSGRGLGRRGNRGDTVAESITLQAGPGGTSPIAGSEFTPIQPPQDEVLPVDPPISNPVPEPTAALLFAAGLGIVAARGRR